MMGLFGKKYSLEDMPSFEKGVLVDCLELVINSGIGDQYKDLYKAVKGGTLKKNQMQECKAFAGWYKDVVLAQPGLKETFGEINYNATIGALGGIENYVTRKLGK